MMKYIWYISLFLSLSSCSKKEFNIENLNGNRIEALGHGGMGISNLYPLNSAESILNCLNLGANGSEIDVQLTKDNVLIAFHDEDLSSTTELLGKVRNHTWEEIRSSQYNSTQYLNYNIIRIEDVLPYFSDGLKLSLDVKLIKSESEDNEEYLNEFADAIIYLIEQNQLTESIFIESQSEAFLQNLQSKNSQIKLFVYPQEFNQGFQLAIGNGLYGISIHNDNITSEEVKIAHENNLRIIIWGVNNKTENEAAILKNPDMIESDDIKNLIDLLD